MSTSSSSSTPYIYGQTGLALSDNGPIDQTGTTSSFSITAAPVSSPSIINISSETITPVLSTLTSSATESTSLVQSETPLASPLDVSSSASLSSPSVAPLNSFSTTVALTSSAVTTDVQDLSGVFATSQINKVTPVAAPGTVSPESVNSSAPPYTPAQIQHAYGVDQLSSKGYTGAGQTIYIVDAYYDPNIFNDVAVFDKQFGLPAISGTEYYYTTQTDKGWGLEESLDVEWAHAIAPAAKIDLIAAKSSSYTDLLTAVNYATGTLGAHDVSLSWGGGDSSGESSLDSYFNKSNVAFFAAAGDTGAQVIYPSASPYVVSVGGTSLNLTSTGAYGSESAWSGGGGGVSKYEKEPGYQTSYGLKYSGRATPDVSYDANPNTGYYVYDTLAGYNGYYEVGGTSAGAPQWAGLAALADQGRAANNKAPLATNSLTSAFEYSAATGSSNYAANFHDITSGSTGYSTGKGYDLATGLGSPIANNLVPYLATH